VLLFDRVIPLKFEELKDALKHLAAHKATGRIVIDMNEEYSECM
jgi:D-arabinose 1-dehydrogenase-like Zn-dependent alcohol dehydrogenase